MTREEAIERLEFLKGVYSVDTETALDMAIEALSAEKPIVKNYDLISRADAIEAVKHSTAYMHDDLYEATSIRIPSTEVERSVKTTTKLWNTCDGKGGAI